MPTAGNPNRKMSGEAGPSTPGGQGPAASKYGGDVASPSASVPLLSDTEPRVDSPKKDKGQTKELFHVGSLNELDAAAVGPSITTIGEGRRVGGGRRNFVTRTLQQATHMMHLRRDGETDGLPTYCVAPDEPCTNNDVSAAGPGVGSRASLTYSTASAMQSLAQLNAEYDVSEDMLQQAFETMDQDGKGVLSYEQVQTAIMQLESLGNLPRSGLAALLKSFNKFRGTTCEEFISGIQDFVASLYKEHESAVQEFFLCDYSKNELSFRPIKTSPSVRETPPVLTGPPMAFTDLFGIQTALPDDAVRWISIVGIDLNVIMALATKFKIHHLMVEDVIGSRLERPKLEVVGDVKHILLSSIYVDSHGALQKCRTHIFMIGDNTVIFIQNGPSQVNEQIQLKLKASVSKLRLSNASFLVYSLVDSLVNEMQLTLQHYLNLLKSLHHVSVSSEKMHQLFHVTRDLAMFAVWIAPVAQILMKLQDEALWAEHYKHKKSSQRQLQQQELQMHLMDLAQNVVALHEEINLVTRWAESKSRELDSLQQFKMTKVVLLLTLVTTAFLPLQLLAGVYGMNFKNMPMISKPWGYTFFWGMGLSVSAIILLIFKIMRWF